MKKVIVFGHSSGLGLAVTKLLLKKGIGVVGFARSKSGLTHPNFSENSVDLTQEKDINRALKIIKNRYSDLSALIYCSGILTSHDPEEINLSEMKYLFDVNFFAAVKIESELLKLIKKNEADIVNVTSSVVSEYYENYVEYNTSKVALQRFTSDLQRKLYGTKSRVMEFRPGAFKSNIYKDMLGDKISRNEQEQMETEDLASVIYFMLTLPKKLTIRSISVDKSY
jgi:NADP+-dependent farnesol dehydrogenase